MILQIYIRLLNDINVYLAGIIVYADLAKHLFLSQITILIVVKSVI